MAHNVRVNGTWRNTVMPYTKVAGVWKPAKAVYNKVNGSWKNNFLQGGINDNEFNDSIVGAKAEQTIRTVATQLDGKILVGGNFSMWNGMFSIPRIVRLNTNGSLDTAFMSTIGTGPNSNISKIIIQPDDKILVGGVFNTWNGVYRGFFVRLNSDGTIDTEFSTKIGTAADSIVSNIALQPDGKILVVGNFTTWNGTTVNRIVRLNADGTRESAFTANTGTAADSWVYNVAIQPDGKILVVGSFTNWNSSTVGYIVRLNSNGTRDTTFTANANNFIFFAATQKDGKIITGGRFTTWNSAAIGRIVRLSENGTIDTKFISNIGTAANQDVWGVHIQLDNRIFVFGDFTTWNGTATTRLIRIGGELAL